MTKALIYKKEPDIGQYHSDNNVVWLLKFVSENDESFVHPLTGSFGGSKTKKAIVFKTKDLATEYAKKNNIDYQIIDETEKNEFFFNSYTKNFI